MDESEDQSYEISLRILGNEIIGVKLSTTSTSTRWVTVAILTIFSSLVLLGAYGEKLIQLYKWLIG